MMLVIENNSLLHFPKSGNMKTQSFYFKDLEYLIPKSFDIKDFFNTVSEARFLVINSGENLGLWYKYKNNTRKKIEAAVETKHHYSVSWEDVFTLMAKDLGLSFPLSSHTFWENF